MEQVRILTWNLERKKPTTPTGREGIDYLHGQSPDAMVLTESRLSFPAADGHLVSSETWGDEDERKVVMWSRACLRRMYLLAHGKCAVREPKSQALGGSHLVLRSVECPDRQFQSIHSTRGGGRLESADSRNKSQRRRGRSLLGPWWGGSRPELHFLTRRQRRGPCGRRPVGTI